MAFAPTTFHLTRPLVSIFTKVPFWYSVVRIPLSIREMCIRDRIIIGQACEFDYSGTQACKALRKLGYEIVLVNSNPATIMTDPETADVTYIEPLNVERLEQIIAKERPDALLPNLGGQSGLNLCSELAKAGILEKYNVQVIGVQVDAIERGEDRIEFKKSMDCLLYTSRCV